MKMLRTLVSLIAALALSLTPLAAFPFGNQAIVAGVKSGPTYAVWDSANKGASVTLSNGNLTFTADAETVIATICKSTGKWYWEVTHTGANGASGAAAATENTAVALGVGVSGFGYWGTTGQVMRNSFERLAASAYTTAVIGYALDTDGQTLEVFEDNVSGGSLSVTAAGEPICPAGGALSGGASGTANFGATAFTYSPPSGYNAGVYQ